MNLFIKLPPEDKDTDEFLYKAGMKECAVIIILFFAFLGWVGCMTSCTKAPVEPRCQSVTQYDLKSGHLVIHWCEVCDEELKRFPNGKIDTICGRKYIWIVEQDRCKQ
jgi:hypothetical protein